LLEEIKSRGLNSSMVTGITFPSHEFQPQSKAVPETPDAIIINLAAAGHIEQASNL